MATQAGPTSSSPPGALVPMIYQAGNDTTAFERVQVQPKQRNADNKEDLQKMNV